jgi:hypothetical protein
LDENIVQFWEHTGGKKIGHVRRLAQLDEKDKWRGMIRTVKEAAKVMPYIGCSGLPSYSSALLLFLDL